MLFHPPELNRPTWSVVVEFRMGWHVKARQRTPLMFSDRRQAVAAAAALNQEENQRLRDSGCRDRSGRLVDAQVPHDFYLVVHETAVEETDWQAENQWW